jgi:hypothetical protein
MPETARASPADKTAIQKRQSIFDSGLARGRPSDARVHADFKRCEWRAMG